MKTNLDFLNETFSIGENGEIICDATIRLKLEDFPLDRKSVYDILKTRFDINGKGIFHVWGKSMCGNEEFDFEKGSHIAETRMQAKAYNKASRMYKLIIEEICKIGDEFNTYRINCIKCENHAGKHLKTLDETL